MDLICFYYVQTSESICALKNNIVSNHMCSKLSSYAIYSLSSMENGVPIHRYFIHLQAFTAFSLSNKC